MSASVLHCLTFPSDMLRHGGKGSPFPLDKKNTNGKVSKVTVKTSMPNSNLFADEHHPRDDLAT